MLARQGPPVTIASSTETMMPVASALSDSGSRDRNQTRRQPSDAHKAASSTEGDVGIRRFDGEHGRVGTRGQQDAGFPPRIVEDMVGAETARAERRKWTRSHGAKSAPSVRGSTIEIV